MVLLKQQIERLMILLSLVEKLRQYHGHEETPEMMAARIDRDVVRTVFTFRSQALFQNRKKIFSRKMKLINKDVLWKLYFIFLLVVIPFELFFP